MIPLNTQPHEGLDLRDGSLEIVKVFKTLQGEGPLAGTPAVFVRLSSCNLTCNLCDTDYTSGRRRVTDDELTNEVEAALGTARLVVLTGGEPFRQDVSNFVGLMLVAGIHVQIETNGTLPPPKRMPMWVPGSRAVTSIVCSPKAPTIHPALTPKVTCLKYVLRHGDVDDVDGLPTQVLGNGMRPARPWDEMFRFGRVYVQPMDEQDEVQNKFNLIKCVGVCLKFGYKLSIQQHKLIGLE